MKLSTILWTIAVILTAVLLFLLLKNLLLGSGGGVKEMIGGC